MNTRFELNNKALTLERYPANMQHPSWQAWDAADEYMIEHIESSIPDYHTQRIGIYNDDFGVLACWFADSKPEWISDSFVAHQACLQNLKANDIDQDALSMAYSLTGVESELDLALIKVPKTLALLEHQLAQLQTCASVKSLILAAGKAKNIQKSTLALFEKYLGPTTTSLARKKARLIFSQPTGARRHANPYPTIWSTQSPAFRLVNHANVFSRKQLDIGARLLLQHLPDCSDKKVIDLGCGNGILGLHVLHHWPSSRLLFVDESHMAVESARQNVAHNLKSKLAQCEFLLGHCLAQYDQLKDKEPADLVLCNPPFHQQHTITDYIAQQMFADARKHLKKGGELRIIGNRHLGYPQLLRRLFGGYKVVASDRKFSILSAIKN